jgi:nicotinate-nucleotide pyrophosphorylase
MDEGKVLSPFDVASLALNEDLWRSDLTTQALKNYFQKAGKKLPAEREFIVFAKEDGVFSGELWCQSLSKVQPFEPRFMVKEGDDFEK